MNRQLASLLIVAASVMPLMADEPQAIAPGAIDVAIRQLDSNDFEVRQRATDFLWQAGDAAKRKLQRATKSDNPEVRLRAQSILDDFRYGVFATTPEDVALLVRQFRRDKTRLREYIWQELLKRAPSETLIAIALVEDSTAKRRQVLARLDAEQNVEMAVNLAEAWREEAQQPIDVKRFDDSIRKQIPYFIAKQDYEKAEELLERYATDSKGMRNWAVYLLLRGKIDQQLAAIQTQVADAGDDKQSLAVLKQKLVHLHRVRGDEAEALTAARQLDSAGDVLFRDLLFDQRRWAELAELSHADVAADETDLELVGFAAAYSRLAGNREQYDQHISTIRDYAERHPGGNESEYAREALYLNGFTDEAIDSLIHSDLVSAFNVQVMRKQYGDAFELAEIGETRESREDWLRTVTDSVDGSRRWEDRYKIALRLAGFLATVGEAEESKRMFEELGVALRGNRDESKFLRQLIEAEVQAKLIDQAFEHAARAYDKDRSIESVGLLFKTHRTSAKTWWNIYNSISPVEATRDRLLRVRRLFYRQNDQDEVVSQIAEAHARVELLPADHASRHKWLHAIGHAYLLHEQLDAGVNCFTGIANDHSPAAIQLADMSRKDKQWGDAAKWYHVAWEATREPYTLYLYGEMKEQLGDTDAATNAKSLARLIPLATQARYDSLASQLARRGMPEAAQREFELLRRCSTWSDLQMFHAIAAISQAVSSDNPTLAASYSEQRMLNCLQKAWHFTDQASYVRIPFEVHQARAKGLLRDNKVDEAVAEMRTCQQIWPAELNLPEFFVPRLDELGRTTAADELFTVSYRHVDATCEMFPNSALHHNNAAWLAARCKRRLDEAMLHINRALELAPDEPQYIDTLGEIHFQQGNIDKAIQCAEKCIELEPGTAFYQEQLERFKAAKQQPE